MTYFSKSLGAVAALLCLTTGASAALITSSADPALTGSTLQDFNALPLQNAPVIVAGDLTFSSLSGGNLRIGDYTEGGVYGGSGNDLSTQQISGNPDFRVDFANTVSAFGMVWGAADPDWTAAAYDVNGTLLDQQTFIGGPPFVAFYGIAAAGISYAIFSAQGGDWLKVDDFQYVVGAPQVPLPAGLPLLLTGLGALALGRRKKA